jgi:hypothetical protein
VLTVTLVDGSYQDIEVPLDSAEEAMGALRNSHIPFGDEWIPTGTAASSAGPPSSRFGPQS